MISVSFKKIVPYAKVPVKAYPSDACFDLFALDGGAIPPYGVRNFSTGIILCLPDMYEAIVRGRSGLASKGVLTFNGTIDAHYRGEIKAILFNSSGDYFKISRGQRIAQLAIRPIPEVKLIEVFSLDDTDRGDKGFGSSGK